MFKGVAWEQISGLAQRLLMFAGGIAVGKGWISEQLMVQIVGVLIGLGGVLWGVKVNTTAALTATVNSLENIKGVVTENTVAGRELANSIPSNTVAAAGTTDAKVIAAATGVTS